MPNHVAYDFIAQITLLTDVSCPKIHGVRNGYQPHHHFDGLDFLVSGKHYYEDEAWHYPGECLNTRIKILNWPAIQAFVRIGTQFQVSEASRRVASGVIMALANPHQTIIK